MDALVWITVRLNAAANLLGSVLTPLSGLAGWFLATLAAVASGVIMLIIFKYTSKQSSIAAVRRQIKANLLALKLFKQSARVVLGSQWRIFLGVGRLLLLAIVPVAVMVIPTTLLLGQLALRYEARPLRIKEEVVLTLALNGEAGSSMPNVQMQPNDAFEDMSGPVRIFSKREVCWNVRGLKNGQHRIVLLIEGQPVEKELVVGSGLQPVSKLRPGWKLLDVLMHPREEAFRPDERVRSIEIEYPALVVDQRTRWLAHLLVCYCSAFWILPASRFQCEFLIPAVLLESTMNHDIIIVSGLPRSGTSLMMQMLSAGGIEVVSDSIRAPDTDNPRGYFEFEQVKKIKHDQSWLPATRGKAFKMVSQLLYDLPATERYRIIFMERDMNEVLASQEKMLARLQQPVAPAQDMAKAFAVHLAKLHEWLGCQTNMAILNVSYRDLIETPVAQAIRVNEFLSGKLNVETAAGIVDPFLYRNRKTSIDSDNASRT